MMMFIDRNVKVQITIIEVYNCTSNIPILPSYLQLYQT